ncbi:MAG: hypothetical protein K940chlam2_00536 [Chlamydiae bacterium]|nr:hypothetical protein [Chlamydiota bacterium]
MSSILKNRYPDLGFLLDFFPEEPLMRKPDPAKARLWREGQDLQALEVVYVLGVLEEYYDLLKDWLSERRERVLIFVEPNLGALGHIEGEWLDNPQVHLRHLQLEMVEVLGEEFPADRVALAGEGWGAAGLTLLRKSSALGALYSDVLYSHNLFENVARNMPRLANAFDVRGWKGAFKGVPLVICGAGPSLEKSIPALKKWRDHALVLAGGSAIPLLEKLGVTPHLGIALDPNSEEMDRLVAATGFEVPLLFSPRLHRDVLATTSGPLGFIASGTGGLAEDWLFEALGMEGKPICPDLGSEAFSVTTLSLSLGYVLGCDPIIFAGVDLAYTGGRRYAGGLEGEMGGPSDPRVFEREVNGLDIEGNPIKTALKWVMESEAMGAFIKERPETHFFNATEGGLGFPEVANEPLESIASRLFKGPLDLEGLVHSMIQEAPSPGFNLARFEELSAQLVESLERCDKLFSEAFEKCCTAGEGQHALWELQLHEEPAYHCFLVGIEAALKTVVPRYYPGDAEGVQRAFWKELTEAVRRFITVLRSRGAYSAASEC